MNRRTHARVDLRIAAVLFVAGACAGPAAGQTKQHPDFVAGAQAWSREVYDEASKRLSSYRVDVPYGKSYDVDYMLGTSWCRIDGQIGEGISLLDWALQQEMPPPAVRQFKLELDYCRSLEQARPPERRKPEQLARGSVGAGATASARGKLFYMPGGDRGSIGAVPLELVNPLSDQEYEARIFAPGEAEAALRATRQRLPGFRVVRHGMFVLAGSTLSDAQLRDVGARLEHFAAFLRKRFDIALPDRMITVQIVPDADALVALASRVHGLKASPLTLGYAFQNDLSISAMMTTTQAGTLLHELFHLLVRAKFGDVPTWLDESMASLYETSSVVGADYLGEPNWRGNVLREMRGQFGGFQLQRYVAWTANDGVRMRHPDEVLQQRPDESAYIAAMGRYFMLYVQEQGRLAPLFAALRDRPASVRKMPALQASLQLITQSVGQPPAELERDFNRWLSAVISAPPARLGRPAGATFVEKELPAARAAPAASAVAMPNLDRNATNNAPLVDREPVRRP